MTTTHHAAQALPRTQAQAGALGGLELIEVEKSYDTRKTAARAVDSFSFKVEPGQFVTLLGPSGCGKTTTLRMIAGFETPTSGDILVDGRSVLNVAPNQRPMSMVFQSYALFPHLSVIDNIGFGLTVKHSPKEERAERLKRVMDLMGIVQYADRYPHELSGGQQQRVALARAIVMEPRILLFDEPLSNLDAKLRMRMREEIRSIQQRLGITSIFVTHDQSEALTMSDVVIVMQEGRIEQAGTPEEIYHRPATTFVASFLGTANFFDTKIKDVKRGQESETHWATVEISGQKIDVRCDARACAGEQAQVMIRSENLHVTAPDSAGHGSILGSVAFAAFDGAVTRYKIDTAHGQLLGQARGAERRFATGTAVSCEFSGSEAWLICE